MMNGDITFWAMVHFYRHELGYGLCAAIVSACVHIQRGEPQRIWLTEAILAAILGSTADLLLGMFGITDTRAGIFVVILVGFVGARTIMIKVMERLGFTFEFKKVDNDTNTKPQ